MNLFKYTQMRLIFLLTFVTLYTFSVHAQKGKKLFVIDGKKYYSEEFEYHYQKNNTGANKEPFWEYVERFVNYKLKVVDALNQKLDTSQKFKTELEGYKKQLLAGYKIEKGLLDSLVALEYERMKEEIKVQHFFVKVPRNVVDTSSYRAKADSILKLLDAGADFSELAYEHSDEQTAKDNKGVLGWITAMRLPFEFETHLYGIKVGQHGKIYRSAAGYHIFKILKRRPSVGKLRVAHLLKYFPQDSADRKASMDTLNTIVERARKGEDFASLVKEFSDDDSTIDRGGELPWFGVGEMLEEIAQASFELSLDQPVSNPVESNFGWHIIKLLEKKQLEPFDEIKFSLKSKIETSPRLHAGRQYFLKKLRGKYAYQPKGELSQFHVWVDSCRAHNKWDAEPQFDTAKELLSFNTKKHTNADFVAYLKKQRFPPKIVATSVYVNQLYSIFVNECLVDLIDSKILDENPKLKRLLDEYHDGILIFELLEKKVWTSAREDSVGLKAFYEQHKQNYKRSATLEVSIFKADTLPTLIAAKELVSKNKELALDSLVAVMKKEKRSLTFVEKKKFVSGDDSFVSTIINAYQNGDKSKVEYDGGNGMLYYVHNYLAPGIQEFEDVKGLVLADYQDFKEKIWIEKLRKEHNVKVYKKALKRLETRLTE